MTTARFAVNAARRPASVAVWQVAPVAGFAVTFAPHRAPDHDEGVLRIAALADDAAERAVARITELGAHVGVRLDRLDGRHGPAVLASLPIGESLR